MRRFYSLARILCSVDNPCYYGFNLVRDFYSFFILILVLGHVFVA